MSKPQRSQAQVEAARLNGAQSAGPVSDEGKAKSAQNSIRHGLCSQELTFENEAAQHAFDRLHKGLIESYIPATEPERNCVYELAVAKWRQDVCLRLELALLQAVDKGDACCMTGGQGLPSLNTIMRYRSRIDRDYDRARTELEDLRRQRLSHSSETDLGLVGSPETLGPNEPKNSIEINDINGLNREQRRRLEAIRRKKKRK